MWTKDNFTDQSGKTTIVTGANTGIGFETALALYQQGAHVILACRNPQHAAAAINRLQAQGGKGTLEAITLDLSDLASVKQFAGTFLQKHQQLDLLINNAGVMTPPASKTVQGYELQFGVNFLGHFALTGHLYPLLKTTSGARVVTLCSMAYLGAAIDFENLKSEKSYDAMREYKQSKLADLLLSVELQRRITATNDRILSIAAQPGANNTELSRFMSDEAYAAAIDRIGTLMEPWQGALPSLYAAMSPEALGGRLYGPHEEGGYRGFPADSPITPNALDEDAARQLWNMAEEVTGVRFPA